MYAQPKYPEQQYHNMMVFCANLFTKIVCIQLCEVKSSKKHPPTYRPKHINHPSARHISGRARNRSCRDSQLVHFWEVAMAPDSIHIKGLWLGPVT